jgi:hypothetical protein
MGGAAVNRKGPGIQSNLASGVPSGALLVVAPALAAVLALAGVTTPKALSISNERIALDLAQARALQFAKEAELAERYRSLALAQRCRDGIELARRRTPAEIDAVVAQGILRLAAEQAGLKVLVLAEGPELAPNLPASFDRIVVEGHELTVSGPLLALARLEQRLRALGYPCCIVSIHAELPTSPGAQPTARVMVGLLHFAPALPTADAPSPEANWNQP